MTHRAVPRALSLGALVLLSAACNRGAAKPDGAVPAAASGAAAPAAAAAPGDRAVTQASAGGTIAPAARSDTSPAGRADASRVQGSPAAKIWVVEVSDFQCPYCKRWHDETYELLRKEYVETGKVRLAYYNMPLPMHQNAWPAAEAAMCAGTQRKFWEMHDALFTSQERWAPLRDPSPVFDSLARGIGVDVPAMRACMATDAVRPLIQADYDRASQAGVGSTPTFIIDQIGLAGAQPMSEFRKVIDSVLATKR